LGGKTRGDRVDSSFNVKGLYEFDPGKPRRKEMKCTGGTNPAGSKV